MSPKKQPDPRLNPRWYERTVTRPAWTRSLALRRAIAVILVILAAASAFRGDRNTDRADVVTASRDLRPGVVLTTADLTTQSLESASIPDGATVSADDALGRTVAGPIRAGETLTDVRLLGPRLAGAALSDGNARVVPIRLADPSLADIVQAGDVVDVLTVDDDGTRVLADGAVVVLVPQGDTAGRQRERLLLLALATDAATSVAAASLVGAMTVVLH